jgi:hypothetical protein
MTKQLWGGIHTQITFIQRRYYHTCYTFLKCFPHKIFFLWLSSTMFYIGYWNIRYRIQLLQYRINLILDLRPSVQQIFVWYWTRQYRCRISVTKVFDVAPTYGYRISLNISVRYQNAPQIFYTLFRYRTVQQQLSPISLITDVGLSVHLWVWGICIRKI